MESDSGNALWVPVALGFTEGTQVQHNFFDGSKAIVEAVPAVGYDEGYEVALVIKDSEGRPMADLVVDRFAALCIAEALLRVLMKQEEAHYAAQKRMLDKLNNKGEQQ